jgi:hypothetical protein
MQLHQCAKYLRQCWSVAALAPVCAAARAAAALLHHVHEACHAARPCAGSQRQPAARRRRLRRRRALPLPRVADLHGSTAEQSLLANIYMVRQLTKYTGMQWLHIGVVMQLKECTGTVGRQGSAHGWVS